MRANYRPRPKPAPALPRVLTIPEMAARLRISRHTLYARVRTGALGVMPFRALYDTGPWRFVVAPNGTPQPLPHMHRRDPGDVIWVKPSDVARTLRVSTRLVRAACVTGVLEAWRSPGGRDRARFEVACDARNGLPLRAGTIILR